MKLFDTHAHYDDRQFKDDADSVLEGMPEKDIALIINAGTTLKTSRESVRLAQRYPFVYAAVGIHPHNAKDLSDQLLCSIKELAQSEKKVVAIGEIGLDYHYDFSKREDQIKCFYKNMELARDLKLPVIIHEREAPQDCFECVKSFDNIGVYHCYSGSLEMAKEILKIGYYISFTGAITFKNAKKALEVVKWAPMDRIMIETDSPYMAPEPFRGQRCDSSLVSLIADKIAEIKGISSESVAEITLKNGMTLFNIKKSD